MSNLIVARFLDGRILKGTSLDVDPGKPTCHLRPVTGAVEVIKLAEVKALFFVKSLQGNSAHVEGVELAPDDTRQRGSSRITLRFADGEKIVALTNRFPPNRPFFFIVPVDTASNNIRILVNRAAVVSVEEVESS